MSLSWIAGALLFIVLLPGAGLARAPTPVASPTSSAMEAELAPVVPEYQQAFAPRMSSMPSYVLDLTLDDAQSTIGGTMLVTFPNKAGVTIDALPLRVLYPNASYYGEGETSIQELSIGGAAIAPRFDDSGTVLFVDLPNHSRQQSRSRSRWTSPRSSPATPVAALAS